MNTNKMKKIFTILSISLLINFGFSEELITRTKFIMGTYISIKLAKDKQSLFTPAFQIFKDLDNKLSIYKERDFRIKRG